ncbi:bacteriocin resistance YdeI/OmpD-like protein [Larkinella arboricola]|uniref:Bacteriocin resistance YdeI/OmpD-like protein n=1 Tax=Larkinella arboricola TaxID=643671 RepID=A0A327XBB4_LARAB|nr:YdeI/OmpD-associated family protein [Larkinella arboricola]RAK02922.1 bacteriocin resistance YdeI/OmpD-like protein [Larkinella arboricola]
MEEPLVDGSYRLKKFEGKGGWTYAALPEVKPDKKSYFNWVKVKGRIDEYELKNCQLMPLGNGQLFLAVKAEIRKQIGKQAGDWVHITLYPEQAPVDTRKDLLLCLEDEPQAHQTFLSYSDDEQKAYIDWIDLAKTEESRIERMAETINRLLRNKKLSDV